MIKLQDLTPEIYTKQSRDFQFIATLYDIVLNHVKTNAANLYQLPIGKNMNEQLLNLLSLTLGFKSTKNYNSKQLLAICSVLPEILKNKGSINALIISANALLAAEGIDQALNYVIEPKKSITLYLSQQLTDLNLLKDLLDYILPAGISCNMTKELQGITTIRTIIGVSDTVEIHKDKTDVEISQIAKNPTFGAVGDQNSILANVTIIKKEDN